MKLNKSLIRAIISIPPHILLKKVLRKSREKTREVFLRTKVLFGDLSISDCLFFDSLEEMSDLNAFIRHKREESPLIDYPETISAIKDSFVEYKKRIIHLADEICSHKIDLLGSGKMNLAGFLNEKGVKDGSYLPWHWDFKGGFQWDRNTFYKDIRYGDVKGQDIKVPWELSRFQHLTPLGQAYILTGDETYTREFIKEIDNWIECNPYLLGVNWRCTMDVAIRAANWLLLWSFFKGSPLITDDFTKEFFKSLLQHGRFIRNNLEWSETTTSNHYLSNIVGLFYIGALIPEFKESSKWRDFALKELIVEMEKQIYEDGTDFEASTCYHRLVLEFFFYSALLCRLKGLDLSDRFIERLKRMFDFVLYTLKPNGRMPQVGDNDSGRLHIFGSRDVLDMAYLLTFGALFFDDPEYKIEEFGFAPEALWIFGSDSYDRWLKMPTRKVKDIKSRAFQNSGTYIIREGKDYLVISCGPNGQGDNGGHAHNDKLSFELSIDGRDVIVDPGAYLYTPYPDWRNLFRSTAYHNTVMINGEEQNRFYEDYLFGMYNDSRARALSWDEGDKSISFEGEHHGYERLKNTVCHRRGFRFLKKDRRWEIRDSFYHNSNKLGEWNLTWHLFFSPGLQIKTLSEGRFLVNEGAKGIISISLPEGLRGEIKEGWYSKEYGVKSKTRFLEFYIIIDKLPREFPWSIEVVK
ncbi:MAG: alginate lyase family protein [Thermodesulfobacteriota bacterium]